MAAAVTSLPLSIWAISWMRSSSLSCSIWLFVHSPEYYHIYQDDNGRDLRGMAQIIIAKHRKGATGDVLLTFRGEFTRFENPEDKRLGSRSSDQGGEILGSRVNGGQQEPNVSPFEPGEPSGPMPF